MNTSTQSNRCLSIKDTARKLDRSRNSVYAMLEDESLAFPRPLIIGRRRYFLESEIDSWLLGRPRVASKSKNGGVK